MSIGTLFLRNRPALDCMCRLLAQKQKASSVSIAVLACSKGAEVYSISLAIRAGRPDLMVEIHALDISKEVLEVAKQGLYSLKNLDGWGWPDPSLSAAKGDLAWHTWMGQNVSVFDRMSEADMELMFDREGDRVRVKQRLREGITWQLGDAGDPGLVTRLGPQDMVVASNFLCHLPPEEAEKCLRNISRLVKPGGYLFVSGVDLEVRTKVALSLGWVPVPDLLAEIHDGDTHVRAAWPWNYCGLEPLDPSRQDWRIRYASVFQVGAAAV